MSAWYVMSAMGFYPVDPCGGEYELGMPLFPEVTLHLPGGNTFTVLCHSEHSEESQKEHPQEIERDSSAATLPQNDTARHRKAFLNGKRIEGTAITHRDIINGGVLEFK